MSVDMKTSEPVDRLSKLSTSRKTELPRRLSPRRNHGTGITSKLSSRRPMPMETEGSARARWTQPSTSSGALPRKGFAADRCRDAASLAIGTINGVY
ncbi:hypothetical protein ACFW04_001857 [Cataglyphis niger]